MSLYQRLDASTEESPENSTDDFADATKVVTSTYEATEHTGSPWSPDLQHGGAVAALLTRAMDRHQPRPQTRLSRVTIEILGPVPIGLVRVTTRVERGGRQVELLAARMEWVRPDGTSQVAAHARAWRLATHDTRTLRHRSDPRLEFPAAASRQGPAAGHPLPEPLHTSAFVKALEWRYTEQQRVHGTPSTAWLRLTHALIDGEAATPLEQAVAISDVANGIGARLDPRQVTFPNTDLSVHLHQPPSGNWFGISAESSLGPDGIGMSAATLHDQDGPIGRIAQTLLLQPRPRTTDAD